jgi:hypothetical protein
MPTTKLTQAAVEKLKKPGEGRVEYWDSQLPGFGLRISGSGRKNVGRLVPGWEQAGPRNVAAEVEATFCGYADRT